MKDCFRKQKNSRVYGFCNLTIKKNNDSNDFAGIAKFFLLKTALFAKCLSVSPFLQP